MKAGLFKIEVGAQAASRIFLSDPLGYVSEFFLPDKHMKEALDPDQIFEILIGRSRSKLDRICTMAARRVSASRFKMESSGTLMKSE